MFRKVVLDYADSLRFEKNKEQFNFAKVWVHFYMLILLPCMMLGNGKGITLGDYYLMVIPLQFGLYTMTQKPICLPKQMYLCPMGNAERRTYVRQLYFLRLLVPIILGMAFHGVGIAVGVFTWKEAGLHQLGLFSIVLCFSFLSFSGIGGEQKEVENQQKGTPRMKGLSTISTWGVLISLVYKVLLVYNSKWQWGHGTWFQIYAVASVVAMIVTDALGLSYLKPALEMLLSYEKSYEVSKKQNAS